MGRPTLRGLRCICGLLFFLSATANASERAHVFYPHLSTPAATMGNGNLAFQAFPGSNGLQSFLFNALDIGLSSRLELGTTPLFWVIKEHRYNYNAKLNFLKLENLHLAVGYSKFAFRTGDGAPPGTVAVIANYELSYLMGAADLFLSDAIALGFHVAKPKLTSTYAALIDANNENRKLEWFVDLALRVSEHVAFTPGFGVLRLETLNPSSAVPMGYGSTLTWIRSRTGSLGRISVGYHLMPSIHENRFLFSFSI
ncbi:MAG: hypothetical protein ACXWQO_09425 [Bdellovibrionota bacterium]